MWIGGGLEINEIPSARLGLFPLGLFHESESGQAAFSDDEGVVEQVAENGSEESRDAVSGGEGSGFSSQRGFGRVRRVGVSSERTMLCFRAFRGASRVGRLGDSTVWTSQYRKSHCVVRCLGLLIHVCDGGQRRLLRCLSQ